MGPTFPMVNIERCDYAEEILKSSKHISKPNSYKLIEGLLGQGKNENFIKSSSTQLIKIFYLISGLISSTGKITFLHSSR